MTCGSEGAGDALVGECFLDGGGDGERAEVEMSAFVIPVRHKPDGHRRLSVQICESGMRQGRVGHVDPPSKPVMGLMLATDAGPKNDTPTHKEVTAYEAIDDEFACCLSSTGYLSKLSYHCTRLPTRNAHEPQKVASDDSYCAPLLP